MHEIDVVTDRLSAVGIAINPDACKKIEVYSICRTANIISVGPVILEPENSRFKVDAKCDFWDDEIDNPSPEMQELIGLISMHLIVTITAVSSKTEATDRVACQHLWINLDCKKTFKRMRYLSSISQSIMKVALGQEGVPAVTISGNSINPHELPISVTGLFVVSE